MRGLVATQVAQRQTIVRIGAPPTRRSRSRARMGFTSQSSIQGVGDGAVTRRRSSALRARTDARLSPPGGELQALGGGAPRGGAGVAGVEQDRGRHVMGERADGVVDGDGFEHVVAGAFQDRPACAAGRVVGIDDEDGGSAGIGRRRGWRGDARWCGVGHGSVPEIDIGHRPPNREKGYRERHAAPDPPAPGVSRVRAACGRPTARRPQRRPDPRRRHGLGRPRLLRQRPARDAQHRRPRAAGRAVHRCVRERPQLRAVAGLAAHRPLPAAHGMYTVNASARGPAERRALVPVTKPHHAGRRGGDARRSLPGRRVRHRVLRQVAPRSRRRRARLRAEPGGGAISVIRSPTSARTRTRGSTTGPRASASPIA